MLDEICTSPSDELFRGCDYIFLCAPVITNIRMLSEIRTVLGKKTILTDVGSVKTGIHQEAERLGLDNQFIGGHPMTGSEKTGFESGNDHLFENAYYILTPGKRVPGEWTDRYYRLVQSLKAIPLVLDYREHDYITAAVSHLPHVIASSLVNTVHTLDGREEHMKMIAAGGFRDITRIVAGDGAYINQMFASSRDYRDSFSFSSAGPVKKIYRIYCDLIDESGAIATIATILAVHSISIKNIGIVHNREFEKGALSIEFYEEDACHQAAELLRHHRYTVWVNE